MLGHAAVGGADEIGTSAGEERSVVVVASHAGGTERFRERHDAPRIRSSRHEVAGEDEPVRVRRERKLGEEILELVAAPVDVPDDDGPSHGRCRTLAANPRRSQRGATRHRTGSRGPRCAGSVRRRRGRRRRSGLAARGRARSEGRPLARS